MAIHKTAVIAPDAVIGKNVEIGPYVTIEDNVVIGDDCQIHSHAKIARYTKIGKRCRIYMGALVGEEPQDHRFYPGLVSSTEIGSDTVIREYVTIHRPPFEGLKTIIGNHVLLMAFVHVAHDCILHDHVTIANHAAITGHVEVGQGAVLSGYVLVHQFSRIGAFAMVTASARVKQDIPPFCLLGDNDYIYGPNTIGLRRAGFDSDQRLAIKKAIKTYFFQGYNGTVALEKITNELGSSKEVAQFVEFIKSSQRGMMPGKPRS
jgi:UDP-N-acetylglucosamine acyltransferase